MLNWVEIDARALESNLGAFRRRLGPGVRLGAVVKSNAYGHGMLPVARIAREAGVSWFCVNGIDEAVRLRAAEPEVKILVMGYVPLDRLYEVVEHRLRPVVYNTGTVERLERIAAAAGVTVPLHVKFETGTQRQGVAEADLLPFAGKIAAAPHLRLEGLSTHFANIEDTTDHGYAEEQLASFRRGVESLRANRIDVEIQHAACSAATLLFTRTHLDLARIGISLYGVWPSKQTYVSCLDRGKPALDLTPAASWKTRIAQVKSVPDHSFVGYGCTYRTTRDSRVAVLPVGYHEGYDRGLSGVAHVLVRGRRAPVRGRICMNMTMIDVTDIPGVEVEDEVVLLGNQGRERLPVEQLADWCGTISYEILARIHPDLPRIVVRSPAGPTLGSDAIADPRAGSA